ncbi:bifunctional adenosylcobinamide kinase/adenosylcobinamide-phosphate guanylyltransferase [Histidinibacterium aquaticum]|uniref:Bifunctional adenosylcobalamin biosynthesis protein n=1 Tax=Histidinibacterium aquaticum TaxID=2613962 RepID=A0A5J5GS91_9RHOB|nr:bifunctional adenosylcobinamide kinase/adenosylcobinamide-phosphate guanylyltransferase [Histidinibacterium aquaticum]KAA9010458.1 bifunctional adenosylcobinamide kinase/adenosylcobinamide-phosphate guanylyltransferase [Histidinibacterium aquaticum]
MTLQRLTLVLGGAASGKSSFAEKLVTESGGAPIYVATAQAFDAEMAEKIAAHRESRGDGWMTVEAPRDLAAALSEVEPGSVVLLDCATMWLTNRLLADAPLDTAGEELLGAVAGCRAPVVVVSNEVGQGIVPEHAMSRAFREAQGRLNQQVAADADLVVAVMAGLPLVLKGSLP